MLGSSMFRSMEDDPFFAMPSPYLDLWMPYAFGNVSHMDHMRRMDSMFPDPFGMMRPPQQMIQLQGQHGVPARPGQQNLGALQLAPRGFMDPMDMFGSIGGMFGNMRGNMEMMGQQFNRMPSDPNGHSFSHSSFMSYSNVPGQGQPKVYQASSSTRVAPGGVRETKKSMRDSEKGIEKMAIGRHIHDRGHVVERSRNHQTGQQDQNEELINLDDDDKQAFNDEWQSKGNRHREDRNRLDYARRGERSHDHRHERTDRHGGGRQLAIESPRDNQPTEHRQRYRDRE